MPFIKISVKKERSSAEKSAVKEAVHRAVREALRIPQHDRNIRYCTLAPEDFETPPDQSDLFTLVEITLFAGRSLPTKKELYRLMVSNLSELGIPPKDITIILYEVPLENWGIRGGYPASEVDLGFEVKV
jgi:phenylpyruvate tautomerase PptA (4-oxalocrotonate tautomerase family)